MGGVHEDPHDTLREVALDGLHGHGLTDLVAREERRKRLAPVGHHARSATLSAMDSGEAAIWGAAIGTVGTLVTAVIVPIVSGTIGARRRAEAARLEALRRAFPAVIRAITSPPRAENLETVADFTMLLKRDEWQIDEMTIAALALSHRPGGLVGGTLVKAVSSWLRGEISPAVAAAYFEEKTGAEIRPTPFPTI